MLAQIRTLSQYKIVKFLFAIFLIIPFGLFGIDYYFRTPLGGDTIATVGNLRVSQGDFDQALRQQQETLQAQFGRNFDSSLMENPDLRRGVLDRVINERLIALGAGSAGVRIDDRQLRERIAAEPAFQDDGKFSRERYEAIARSQGFSVVAWTSACGRTCASPATAMRSSRPRSCRARPWTGSSACRSRAAR